MEVSSEFRGPGRPNYVCRFLNLVWTQASPSTVIRKNLRVPDESAQNQKLPSRTMSLCFVQGTQHSLHYSLRR